MLDTLRQAGKDIVDVKAEHEDAYAGHCRAADELTRPLRDCITYYNGHGEANPAALRTTAGVPA